MTICRTSNIGADLLKLSIYPVISFFIPTTLNDWHRWIFNKPRIFLRFFA
jgi:hypothetical protein